MELSQEEVQALSEYQTGYEMLGEDLALECYLTPEKIIPVISMFSNFCRDAEQLALLRNEAADIPCDRRKIKLRAILLPSHLMIISAGHSYPYAPRRPVRLMTL